MPRTCRMQVRLTEREEQFIQERADRLGMTKSDYVRMCSTMPIDFTAGIDDSDAVIAIDVTTYRKILIEARRWGANFNQATRALNTIGLHYVNPPRGAERAEEVVQLAARAMDAMNRAKGGMDEIVRIAGVLEGRAAMRANMPDEW